MEETPMLVLSRKIGERLVIGDDIVLTVLSVRRGQIRLGIDAPRSTAIHREELLMKDSGQTREGQISVRDSSPR